MNRAEEIKGRLANVRDIGAVVSALRALALGRRRDAARRLSAIAAHEDAILSAMGQALALTGGRPPRRGGNGNGNGNGGAAAPRPGAAPAPGLLILIGVGQGFTGAFGDRLAEAAQLQPGEALAAIGARTVEALAATGVAPVWTADAPARAEEAPVLAARLADFLFAEAAAGRAASVRALHADPEDPGAPPHDVRLLPFDYARVPAATGPAPLITLPPAEILSALVAEYVHAELCAALMRGFAAESAARAEAMSRAQGNIRNIAAELEGEARRARQEAMTSEIVELALCAAAPPPRRRKEGGEAAAIGLKVDAPTP